MDYFGGKILLFYTLRSKETTWKHNIYKYIFYDKKLYSKIELIPLIFAPPVLPIIQMGLGTVGQGPGFVRDVELFNKTVGIIIKEIISITTTTTTIRFRFHSRRDSQITIQIKTLPRVRPSSLIWRI